MSRSQRYANGSTWLRTHKAIRQKWAAAARPPRSLPRNNQFLRLCGAWHNRKGIDGLARVCKEVLRHDPFSGWGFVFRNRPATALKVLIYDGQGFWLCHKRLSSGQFRWWPKSTGAAAQALAAHQLHVLFSAGDPEATQAALAWRPFVPRD